MNKYIDNFLNLLFPKRCVSCSKSGYFLCLDCIKEIKQTELVCPMCERASLGGVTHPVCRRSYGLDGLWSLGIYENPLRIIIQKLKYKWVTECANDLIDLLTVYWSKNPPFILDLIKKDGGKNWIIVPVPLHKQRQNWRGFNQSALLGREISRRLGLDYQDCLLRVKNTKPQMKLSAFERKRNIKNAFSLSLYNPEGKNIILVDDVWTTGSTLRECSIVLKRTRAKSVWALTLAR